MPLRNAFSPSTPVISTTPGDDLTQQQFKDEADINTITSRYIKTGVLGTPGVDRRAMFGDFTAVDFQTMRNRIADIDQDFESLPSKIRNKFQNDPYQLIRWLDNPQNMDEAIKLGLIPDPNEPVPVPAGTAVPAAPAAPAPAASAAPAVVQQSIV